MTIDEAITHAIEVAEKNEADADTWCKAVGAEECAKEFCRCAEDHRQIASWLQELKTMRGGFVSREAYDRVIAERDKQGASVIGLGCEDFATLAICAIRYCQGRETYMPKMVRNIVKPHIGRLSDRDIGTMIRDCDTQFLYGNYGDERIDKPGWIEWRELLEAERDSRGVK